MQRTFGIHRRHITIDAKTWNFLSAILSLLAAKGIAHDAAYSGRQYIGRENGNRLEGMEAENNVTQGAK